MRVALRGVRAEGGGGGQRGGSGCGHGPLHTHHSQHHMRVRTRRKGHHGTVRCTPSPGPRSPPPRFPGSSRVPPCQALPSAPPARGQCPPPCRSWAGRAAGHDTQHTHSANRAAGEGRAGGWVGGGAPRVGEQGWGRGAHRVVVVVRRGARRLGRKRRSGRGCVWVGGRRVPVQPPDDPHPQPTANSCQPPTADLYEQPVVEAVARALLEEVHVEPLARLELNHQRARGQPLDVAEAAAVRAEHRAHVGVEPARVLQRVGKAGRVQDLRLVVGRLAVGRPPAHEPQPWRVGEGGGGCEGGGFQGRRACGVACLRRAGGSGPSRPRNPSACLSPHQPTASSTHPPLVFPPCPSSAAGP